jgi:hypothetical protein
MTANDQNKLIPLELTLDELAWLRIFLREESLAAEIDQEKVETLHTVVVTRAARDALNREYEQITTIADKVDRTISIIDKRESLARQIAAMTPPVA